MAKREGKKDNFELFPFFSWIEVFLKEVLGLLAYERFTFMLNLSCLLYSDVVKGGPSPTKLRKYQEEDEEEALTKKTIKELEIFVS